MSTPASIAASRGGRTGTGTVTCNICLILSLSTLLALGIVFWYAAVHARIVFLHEPYLTKSNVPYYALMSDHDAARAEFWSFDGIAYLTDFLVVLLLFATPAYVLVALCCHFRMIWPLTLLYVLFGLWWLFKAVYLSFYWTNATWLWSNFACDRYPFCRNRDTSLDPAIADGTFVIEVIYCYVIGVGGIVLACIIPALWSGVRERQMYAFLQSEEACEKCGTKPRSLLSSSTGGGGVVGSRQRKKTHSSDDDSIGNEFTVDDEPASENENAIVVYRNQPTTVKKRPNPNSNTTPIQQQQQQQRWVMEKKEQTEFEIPDIEY